ncbi:MULTISPECIES: hypothetical protein [Nocardiopsis]|jgi:hypothetical protein|uniref:hypothetical protein n=1 Tax=Nocardiopsis TaxID=2013 RepID=UPI0003496121|nr:MULTISPECIES: hypothetical protein [Nocardiopsis]
MAKSIFKIPTSLDRSFLDHEIALAGGGWQMRPLPVKVILFWVASVMLLFWVCTSTFVSSADWWLIGLVIVWWLAATAFFGQYSKTKELRLTSLPALVEYVPQPARRIITRRGANPSSFSSVVGIQNIDQTGYIEWWDGTVGQAYLVVGSASVLVFDEDKKAILNRVDGFWRKTDTNVEYIWITTKEPQRVYRQLGNLELLNQGLEVRDPELFELLDERYSILKNYVGGQFNSIHQYLVIKADNLEALRRAHALVRAEVEGSSLMIKQATMLGADDLHDMLRTLYTTAR